MLIRKEEPGLIAFDHFLNLEFLPGEYPLLRYITAMVYSIGCKTKTPRILGFYRLLLWRKRGHGVLQAARHTNAPNKTRMPPGMVFGFSGQYFIVIL
jgi:hypothetical protein